VREVGYGLSLEGASSADLIKSKRAKSFSAVQTCVFKALAEVPTNVFTRSDCWILVLLVQPSRPLLSKQNHGKFWSSLARTHS
jgi:hypothetical protein